jgi:hypothetical protein
MPRLDFHLSDAGLQAAMEQPGSDSSGAGGYKRRRESIRQRVEAAIEAERKAGRLFSAQDVHDFLGTAAHVAGGVVTATVIHGDCLDVMRAMEPNSVDAIVTDPPAGISFMGKAWDADKGGRDQWIAWLASVLAEGLRVLKPGGHALVWALPRTSHWTGMALEDAGFEVRDRITHLFGSGFPKSADVSKHLDAQERTAWLNVSKALDNLDASRILEAWIEHSSTATSAGLSFAKSATATGIATPSSDSVPSPVLLSVSRASSPARALIAEFRSSEAPLTDAAFWRSVLSPADEGTTELSALVILAGSSPASLAVTLTTRTSTAPPSAWAWVSESTASRLKAVEALRIWLGSKPSSRPAATTALCAALTDDLKHITLSRSRTFQNFDTASQTECVSAIAATTTASTAASLISFTVGTLRLKALAKAEATKREVIGVRPIAYPDSPSGYTSFSANSSCPPKGGIWAPGEGEAQHGRPVTAPATDLAKRYAGFGTALKPAAEDWWLARKPLVGTVARTVSEYGTGALNIDGCRIGTEDNLNGGAYSSGGRSGLPGDQRDSVAAGMFAEGGGRLPGGYEQPAGRWPANVVLSHSPECRQVGTRKVKSGKAHRTNGGGNTFGGDTPKPALDDLTYADADGYEEVPHWECAPDCAAALLDAQSGERGASGKSTGAQKGAGAIIRHGGTQVDAPSTLTRAARPDSSCV